jgi:hypothetical protein
VETRPCESSTPAELPVYSVCMRDIDKVIERVKAGLPNVFWEQLKVPHPADDNGLWFFSLPGLKEDVQAESSSGMCPFIVEGNQEGQCVNCPTVEETADRIIEWLKLMS